MSNEYILTISCPDVPNIVASVAGFIAKRGGFILEASQYGDPVTERFFQRIHFSTNPQSPDMQTLKQLFANEVGEKYNMHWNIYDASRKPRLMVMVSKAAHCLNTLLHRAAHNSLQAEIPLVVSNHPDLQRLVAWYNIPYYHLPIDGDKAKQEERIRELALRYDIDLLVLARYMQVLSPQMCEHFAERAINIHHSFLPSFKGAKPYHQAHARGVKLIGATAHYVTSDLDEGPIIEQEVMRVNHKHTAEDLVSIGEESESNVLYRAVRYHCEHRVLLNGNKTVVFE
jgi:formyltetrahydrofolate deformylase